MIVLYTTERDYPWGTLRSTHGSKTKVVLEEKGLRYRIENLPPGNLWKKPPEMLAKHPLGKVPYLEDDGRYVLRLHRDRRIPRGALSAAARCCRRTSSHAREFARPKTSSTRRC